MARAVIIVEKWDHFMGWQYDKGFPASDDPYHALKHAFVLENLGTLVRVYRRTPEGPQVIYKSPEDKED